MIYKVGLCLLLVMSFLFWPVPAHAKPLQQSGTTLIRVCYDKPSCDNPTNSTTDYNIILSGYTRQVLANEWPSNAGIEAFKAGTIAIRSFAYRTSPCGAYQYNYMESAGPPPSYSRLITNVAQSYRLGNSKSSPQNPVSSTHSQAEAQTDTVVLYRTDNTFACAKYKTDVGNPTLACVAGTCTNDTTDQNTLSSVADPVSVSSTPNYEGMGQNGTVTWSLGPVPWNYRQMLSHYYKQVKIGGGDNNSYRWTWLNVGNNIAFTSPTTGRQYYAPVSNTPTTMGAGITYGVPWTLQNTGSTAWNSGAVALSYHWYNSSNVELADRIYSYIIFPVQSAEPTAFTANVRAPGQPGTYTLKWDMLQNGVWFSQNNWPTQNITVQVKHSLNEALWQGNQGWTRSLLIDDSGNIQWTAAPAWSGPIALGSLPGSGDIQTQAGFIAGTSFWQIYWRGGEGRSRTVPIQNGVIQWNQVSAWSNPAVPISSLPGASSGDIQAQGDFVMGNTLWQSFWRGHPGQADSQSWSRTVQIINGAVAWGTATVWPQTGTTMAALNLPGSGDLQATDNFVIGNTLWQTFWRNNQQYTRSVPIQNGVLGTPTGWSITTGSENLPNNSSIQTQGNYVFP